MKSDEPDVRPVKAKLSDTMWASLEAVVREDVTTLSRKGRIEPLVRRGLVDGRWIGAMQYWEVTLTEAGRAVLGEARVSELEAEAAAETAAAMEESLRYQEIERASRKTAAARAVEPDHSDAAPPRHPISASIVSGRLRKAGWNPRYKGTYMDGMEVQQRNGFDVTVIFRYYDSTMSVEEIQKNVTEVMLTLRWLGYAVEQGNVTEGFGTVYVAAQPRVDRGRYPFAQCPLCDRREQPLKKLSKDVHVFPEHMWMDRVTPCEGAGLTPEQAQQLHAGQAPGAKYRVKLAEEK